jgi:REP element-mobilizing transposase RayT
MLMKVGVQRELFVPRKPRGGARKGAGRPAKGRRAGSPHRKRPELKARHPVHVVLRATGEIQSLRCKPVYRAIQRALVRTAKREDCRIVHISIQRTHVHLLVEARDERALARGMQGFQISAARNINSALSARRRTVFPDRYHATAITSPRQARHVLAYVLCNWRKHQEDRSAKLAGWKIDWFSSGATFDDWAELGRPCGPAGFEPLHVSPAQTWLLSRGWKLHGERLSCFTSGEAEGG